MNKREYRWPNACNRLLENAFTKNNIKVHWSLEADCDDTIATFADKDNASILSGDKDFLCYLQHFKEIKIYSKFEIDEKRNLIFFTRQTRRTKDHKPHWKLGEIKRQILNKKPVTEKTMTNQVLLGVEKNKLLCGYPNALPHYSFNPHKKVRELRRALYYFWGLRDIVIEEIPDLNTENQVVWSIEEVDPQSYDTMFIELLANPEAALKFYENNFIVDQQNFKISKSEWSNYLNGFFSVILSLCSFYSNESLLTLLKNYKYLALSYLSKNY